jgi:iron(III) transport system substrate-binding protein
VVSVFLLSLNLNLHAQEKAGEKQWADLIAAAKKEGKVVVRGFLGSDVVEGPPAKFTAKYGVPVEALTSRSSDVAAKLRTERQAGIYSTDVFLAGIGTLSLLYQEKMLDPIKPALIAPGVVDPSKWKKGKPWFMDPEDKYILRLLSYVTGMFYLNTKHVKPEEFRSIKDLLNPKWQGKISADDPTVSGSGVINAAQFYLEQGEDFVRKLYIEQKPVFSRNTRQLADWLARGTYPIALNISSRDRERLKEEGFPIVAIYSLPDAPGSISASSGVVALMNKAPHPNAARLFINWLASKEGLEEYSRTQLIASTRTDVDESFLPPEAIPRAGLNYFDSYDWNFTVVEREKIRLRMKEILKR